MLKIYSYNNGAKWAIRVAGPKFTFTAEEERIALKAPNNWNSEKEAEEWLEAQK